VKKWVLANDSKAVLKSDEMEEGPFVVNSGYNCWYCTCNDQRYESVKSLYDAKFCCIITNESWHRLTQMDDFDWSQTFYNLALQGTPIVSALIALFIGYLRKFNDGLDCFLGFQWGKKY